MFEILQEIEDFGLYLGNCISKEDIEEILELSKSDLLEKGSSRLGPHVVVDDGTEWRDYLKDFTESERHQISEVSSKIFNKIHPVMIKAMEIYTSHFGLDMNEYTMTKPPYWIKTYDIGANIGKHSDSWESTDGKTLVPAVSIVFYLSSDFGGGELVFVDKDSIKFFAADIGLTIEENEKDIVIKPSAGNLVVFDSSIIHRVNEVTSGTRISTDITYMK
jgi:predicted 2-oxoglutarate/Fe(II)-dependent dioxygenase YbiX